MARNSRPLLAINGFRDDVSLLLSGFLQKNSFRFRHFVEVWEEMKFGFVFGGIPATVRGLTELHEFTEKCFREAISSLIIPPNEPINQVAGLYLLYSLYISRPLHCQAKIRIHPKSEMELIVALAGELVQNEHLDAVYCFLELYEANAFCYTLTPYEMGFHTQRSKGWRDDSSIKMYIPDVPKLLTSQDISKVLDTDRIYNQTKQSYLQEPESTAIHGQDSSQLGHVTGQVIAQRLQKVSDDYMKSMHDLYHRHGRNEDQHGANSPTDRTDATETIEETILEKRQRLRRQQMSRNVRTQDSR